MDCGLQQGRDELDNSELPFNPADIDFVLITHAHIDHSGRVPLLVKQGFHGTIITTRLTAELMEIMLQDSAHIQESDAMWLNRKGRRAGKEDVEPLYTIADAMKVKEYVQTCEYDENFVLLSEKWQYYVDGIVAACQTHFYDVTTAYDGPPVRVRATNETYDADGNPTELREYTYQNNILQKKVQTSYQDGKIQKKSTENYNGNGEVISSTEVSFDENGNPLP